MNPIHFGTKRSFWLIRALGSLGLAAAGVAMATTGRGSAVVWMGVAAVVFFGVGAVVGIVQGTRRGPRLTLDADGVHDRTLGVGVIAWPDIAGVAPYLVAQKPFVGLHLREPAKYVARASGLKQLLVRLNAGSGMPPFSLNLAGLDADPTQVVELLASMQRKLGGRRQDTAREFDRANDDDDEADHEPPSAERVARRALVLAAVAARGDVERRGATADNVRFQHDMLRWLDEAGAGSECEPHERRLLEAAIASLTPRDVVNASWNAEGMAVLAWALGRAELPPFDHPCRTAAVAQALGFLQPPQRSAPAAASLREPQEIAAVARRIFTVHWRLREFSLRREPIDFGAVAARTNFGLDLGGLPIVDGDLAIDDVPLARVSEDRWRECLSIAVERHRALNWLKGSEPVYSEVSTDT